MAIDNLNVMTSWLPAGQQTDQYSTKPWCLRSKNLDIFSSSKSAKGTAWSWETQEGSDIIKEIWSLTLKTDGKVYDYGVEIANPRSTFPQTQVSYNGMYGSYITAWWWNSKDMIAKYEGNFWKTFTVFSDSAQYTYNKNWYIISKRFWELTNCSFHNGTPERWSWTNDPTRWLCEWYEIEKTSNSAWYCSIEVYIDTSCFSDIRLAVGAYKYNESHTQNAYPYLDYIQRREYNYYYDPQVNEMVPKLSRFDSVYYWETYWTYDNPVYITRTVWPNTKWATATIYFRRKKVEWASDYKWDDLIMVNFIWWPDPRTVENMERENNTKVYEDCFYTYNLLPIKIDRKLKKIWEYYWEKWDTTQTLYQYAESRKMDPLWQHVTDYNLEQYMAWENPATMDVIDMISWNEKIYMIGNMDGNGYIIPCELTGWKGTPYIAYGCTFKGATNIDYLMYLVGEDRGISQLWCYNTQELVPLIWGDKKKVEVDSVTHEKADNDFIDTNEQYRFNWKMVEYRGDLVLATEDNRLFRYGQTAGGKGWSFIFDIPWEITDLRTENDNLIVSYEVTRTETDENEQEVEVTYKYNRTYQDDIADKNYLTEREAVYPIALWNHLLEKEESDLYTSYILPSKDCKLEFWGAGNHYHYRTFKVWNVVPWSWVSPTVALNLLRTWKLQIAGTTWDYNLEYVEDDGTRFTYRLVGDLPQQTENSIKQLTKATTNHNDDPFYTFTEFHHFRKIGEITAEGYTEGEYRFHNLNNKLELPKTHSLQIMVKGAWTAEASPELFTVDLIANQRERW